MSCYHVSWYPPFANVPYLFSYCISIYPVWNASNWKLFFLFMFWESFHSSGLSFTREAFHFTIVKQYWDWVVLIQIFSSRFAGCVYQIWNNTFVRHSAKFIFYLFIYWSWVSYQTETKVLPFLAVGKKCTLAFWLLSNLPGKEF